jgi:hypothetical protein
MITIKKVMLVEQIFIINDYHSWSSLNKFNPQLYVDASSTKVYVIKNCLKAYI